MDRDLYPTDIYPGRRTPGYGEGGNMFRGITGIIAIVAVITLALGFVLSWPDVLNPRLGMARADRMDAETAALLARNAYEQQLRQLELDRQRAVIEQDLKSRERWALILEDTVALMVLACATAVVVLAFGGAVHLASLRLERLRPASAPLQAKEEPRAAVLPFPARRPSTTGPTASGVRWPREST